MSRSTLLLITIYVAYLFVLSRIPPKDEEGLEDLERIPQNAATWPRWRRNLLNFLLFAGGGGLIYFSVEPYLASLLAVSALIAVPSFVLVQWVAPIVSEFSEKVSGFYIRLLR
jgi:cation:H+ antiporter